jgi:hypothetical protein
MAEAISADPRSPKRRAATVERLRAGSRSAQNQTLSGYPGALSFAFAARAARRRRVDCSQLYRIKGALLLMPGINLLFTEKHLPVL